MHRSRLTVFRYGVVLVCYTYIVLGPLNGTQRKHTNSLMILAQHTCNNNDNNNVSFL